MFRFTPPLIQRGSREDFLIEAISKIEKWFEVKDGEES
jgi:hypothetical protein